MSNEAVIVFFAKFIEKELGIVYSEHNYFQLETRLEEIAKALEVQGAQALFEMAQKGISGKFKQLLLDVATNNETSFFRDPKIFQAIEVGILAVLKERRETKTLRIWSAASSTGQEALSIAMLIREWNSRHGTSLDFEILGTDISERALAKAKSANYSQLEVQRGLDTTMLGRYFDKSLDGAWMANATLRSKMSFRSLNLKEPFFFAEKFDLILCRNVLIYQNVDGKKAILEKVTASLAHEGFLILGSGESLIGLTNDYEQLPLEGAILYRKKDQATLAA